MTAPPPTTIPGKIPWGLRGEVAKGYAAGDVEYPNDVFNRALKWMLLASGYDLDIEFSGLFGPVFNVVSRGAVADGVTDNYIAISETIALAKAAKGMVYFPTAALPYGTSSGWQFGITDGLLIWGYGATVKLIKDAASDSAGRIFNFNESATVSNVTIFGLTLDGNKSLQTVSEQRSGIFLHSVNNFRLIDVTIKDTMGDCIQVHGDGDGSPCKGLIIKNCFLQTPTRHLISITDGEKIIIENNIGEGAGSGGIHIEGEGSAPITRLITIRSNHISDCVEASISVTAAGASVNADRNRDIEISGNTCEDQGIIGFALYNVRIISNTVINATGSGTDGIGIYFNSPFGIIHGNTITAPTQFGILCQYQTASGFTYGKGYATITNNIIRNLPANVGTSEGIRLNSSVGCIVAGNIIQNDNATATTIGIRCVAVSAPEPCTNNIIENNKVYRCATAFVSSINNTSNHWINNKGYVSGSAEYSLVTGDYITLPDTMSADRGDNNVTLVTGTDNTIQNFDTTLTGNKTVTLSSTSACKGSKFKIVRRGLGAFTLDVGGLKTIPSDTAAFVEVMHNGTAWVLTGYGAL